MLKDGSIKNQAHNYQLNQDLKKFEQSPHTQKCPGLAQPSVFSSTPPSKSSFYHATLFQDGQQYDY